MNSKDQQALILCELNTPESELGKRLVEYENKYKADDNRQEILEEIRSYDIWKGFSSRVVISNFQLLFGSLFCIYTLVIHALNAGFVKKLMSLF